MILKLKHYQQDTVYHCGPAALQIMLRNVGIFESEKKLSKKLKTNPEIGTKCAQIIRQLKKYELDFFVKEKSRLLDIKKFLKRRMPIMVLYVENVGEESHFAVVVGYDKENFYLSDPYHGPNLKISQKEFYKRWSDSKNEKVRWLVVIL